MRDKAGIESGDDASEAFMDLHFLKIFLTVITVQASTV